VRCSSFDLGPNTEQDHGPDSRVYRCSHRQAPGGQKTGCGTGVHTHSLVAESRELSVISQIAVDHAQILATIPAAAASWSSSRVGLAAA
jgi:hypothetical protein